MIARNFAHFQQKIRMIISRIGIDPRNVEIGQFPVKVDGKYHHTSISLSFDFVMNKK